MGDYPPETVLNSLVIARGSKYLSMAYSVNSILIMPYIVTHSSDGIGTWTLWDRI